MHKSEKNSKKLRVSQSPAKMGALVLLALVSLLFTSAVAGQQGEKVKKKDLTDKLGEGVSAKEPHFKLATKQKRTREDRSALLGWRAGEDFVSVTFYECPSPEDAAIQLQATIKAPVSVHSETVKLNNLGDEAYIREHGLYSKPGTTSLFLRRGNVIVVLSASSPQIAKRFAKHIVDEIDQP